MSANLPNYPSWAVTAPGDPVYTEGDIPSLKAAHGEEAYVLCRHADGALDIAVAPVEIVGFGVVGRCVRVVPAATLLDFAQSDEIAQLVQNTSVLVCAPPFDGAKAEALVDLIAGEVHYFSAALRRVEVFDTSLAIGHAALTTLLEDATRRLEHDTKAFAERVREVCMPTGRWGVYDPGRPEALTEDKVASLIRGYASRSLRVSPPLPVADPRELAAMRDIFLRLCQSGDALSAGLEKYARALIMAPAVAAALFKDDFAPLRAAVDIDSDDMEKIVAILVLEQLSQDSLRMRAEVEPEDDEETAAEILDRLKRHQRVSPLRFYAPHRSGDLYNSEGPPPDDIDHINAAMQKYWDATYELDSNRIEIERVVELRTAVAVALRDLELLGVYPRRYEAAMGMYSRWTGNPEEACEYVNAERAAPISAAPRAFVPATPAAPWVFDIDQLLAFKAKYGPKSREDAFERLDIYVGGYLGALDLSRTMITGSAMAAALIRVEDSDCDFHDYNKSELAEFIGYKGAFGDPDQRATFERLMKSKYKSYSASYVEWLDGREGSRHVRYKSYLSALYPTVYTDPASDEDRRAYIGIVSDPWSVRMEVEQVGERSAAALPARVRVFTDEAARLVTASPRRASAGNDDSSEDDSSEDDSSEDDGPKSVYLAIRPGADVDMAIDVATDAEFDAVARGHYEVIRAAHSHAVLVRVAREGDSRYNWAVVAGDLARISTFRQVEMYRATFDHIVAHHVGMVSAAYTARFHAAPTFVASARFVSSMIHLRTPNYYYFASRKYTPQEVILKYYARGFGLNSFPVGIVAAIMHSCRASLKWAREPYSSKLYYPATNGKGNFSAFSLQTEFYARQG
jgi:hypothetical protein